MKKYLIYTAVVGDIQTNCYIIHNTISNEGILIDAGDNYNELMKFMDNKGIKPVAVLCTHGHYDHINACLALQERGIKIYISSIDAYKCESSQYNEGYKHYNYIYNPFKADITLNDNDEINLIGIRFKVILCGGHTKGGVSYICEINKQGYIFCGDTLFKDSYGRYDFYDGDFNQLKVSANKLLSYPSDYLLMSGHGEPTVVGYEKNNNPISINRGNYVKLNAGDCTFSNDLLDVVKAFSPYVILDEFGAEINFNYELTDDNFVQTYINCTQFYGNSYEKSFKLEQNLSEIKKKSEIKRYCKISLYNFLSEVLKVKLPYGSLTGIRPTKLYRDLEDEGEDAFQYFLNTLMVSNEKTNFVEEIVNNQKPILSRRNNEIDVFINIPFCLTRCSYCSFISAEYSKIKKFIPDYVDLLIREINSVKEIVKDNNFSVRAVYVGGGTPTSLEDEYFEKIMAALDFDCIEFTVEAGRPDTITKTKLDIMKKYKVTRISVNPQTFNQKTLDKIGRAHTVQEIFETYKLARNYPFDINMDLIAMLPDESFKDFKYSVDTAISLNPDNITVHTLALKRGSRLTEEGYDNNSLDLPTKMVDYSYEILKKADYSPYYMYKQKYMSGNLENTGYCLKDKQCLYNVDIMEETNTIIACGAGGITKVICNGGILERHANPKGLDVYLSRNEEIIKSKRIFIENLIDKK